MYKEEFPISININPSDKDPDNFTSFSIKCAHCNHQMFTRFIAIGPTIVCECAKCLEASTITFDIRKFGIETT